MEYLHKNKILYRDLKVFFNLFLAIKHFSRYSRTFENNRFWHEQVWILRGKCC